jgi:ABC-2 type transport system permease protein
MMRLLIKKQVMELFSFLWRDRRTGKLRTKASSICFGVFYLALFAYLGVMFYFLGETLCPALLSVGMGWSYMTLMSLITLALGVVGCVFSTYSSLYRAKDNDLLLSMPISSRSILTARLLGVYLVGLLYELTVMIPALIVYFRHVRAGVLGVIFALLLPLLLSVFTLTLSCALGWLVALVAGKIQNTRFVTLGLSLAFLVGYFYFVSRANEILNRLLASAEQTEQISRTALYPFYLLGKASMGDWKSMLIITVIFTVLAVLMYLLLSKSFLTLATANKGASAVRYKEKTTKKGSIGAALLKKEWLRFTSSATYMLNCGLGLVFLPVIGVVLIVKADMIRSILPMMESIFGEGFVPLLAAGALCMAVSMIDITAPSVSLEGKHIWIAHINPIPPVSALMAKLYLQLILTLPFLIVISVVAMIVLKISGIYLLLVPLCAILFAVVMAALGLFCNLLLPNLNWTSEIVPVKQGLAVGITLLGGMCLVGLLALLYYLVAEWIAPLWFLVGLCAVFGAVAAALIAWIRTKGARIFAKL